MLKRAHGSLEPIPRDLWSQGDGQRGQFKLFFLKTNSIQVLQCIQQYKKTQNKRSYGETERNVLK